MTLILALAIVAVFCAGIMRLWWNNRLMNRQEVLDEEKRARLEEMRKTGLPVKRANEIPFGVRAIQGGVEVDGIWISRPASSEGAAAEKTPLASSTTLVGTTSVLPKKGQGVSGDEQSRSTTPMAYERAPSRQNVPNGSIFQRLNHGDSSGSARFGVSSVSQFVPQTRRPPLRMPSPLNEDTLRKLEGQAQQSKPPYETYIPTSPQQSPRQVSHQSSGSSSGDSVDSRSRSVRSVGGKSASSHSSRPHTTRHPREGRYANSNAPQTWGSQELYDPFRTPSALSVTPYTDTRGRYDLVPPEPTLNPGDLHLNRSSQRANDKLDLPSAATFDRTSEK